MMIKGRSPTMRHVSRTHRVALDWLFDRINLDSKIPIRYIDTKHQLADILTKGNFTRDEWNTILHLFNTSHFSSVCCGKNSSLISCPKTLAKRMQEQKRRRKNCGEIQIYSDELVLNCFDEFLICNKSDCIQKSGDTQSTGKPGSRMRMRINSKSDAASTSQGRLQDAYLGGVDGQSSTETCRNRQKSEIMGVF